MNGLRRIVIKFFLALFLICFSKLSLSQVNFSIPDSIAKEVSKVNYSSVNKLALELTKNLENDLDKFRAVYRWITINIKYDKNSIFNNPNDVLRRKNALCIGYSMLLQSLCSEIGIECAYIEGLVKLKIKDLDKITESHAWNAVKINGSWVLTDLTWASSKQNGDSIYSTFDDNYFIMKPELFELNHFAHEKKWRFTRQSKRQFKKRPIYYSPYFNYSNYIKFETEVRANNNLKDVKLFVADSVYKIEGDIILEIRAKGILW